MSEEHLISLLTLLMIAFGVLTAVALIFFNMKAAYGRYYKETSLWQWSINANLAWFVQDLPALSTGLHNTVAQWSSEEGLPLVNASVLALYTFHYAYRTFIHSLGIRGGKPTPLHIALIGIVYVAWEAYIVCAYHAKYAHYPADHVTSTVSLTGIILFFSGFLTHVHSDHVLRNLRKPGETDYKIPRGGLFDYVSTPNYLGESIMWSGFALYAQSFPAAALAFNTVANFGPRALQHHRWYLEKFDDYPKNRKVFIPFVT